MKSINDMKFIVNELASEFKFYLVVWWKPTALPNTFLEIRMVVLYPLFGCKRHILVFPLKASSGFMRVITTLMLNFNQVINKWAYIDYWVESSSVSLCTSFQAQSVEAIGTVNKQALIFLFSFFFLLPLFSVLENDTF